MPSARPRVRFSDLSPRAMQPFDSMLLVAAGLAIAAACAVAPAGAALVEGTVSLPGPDRPAAGAVVRVHPLAEAAGRYDLAGEMEGWALAWKPAGGGTLSGQGRLAPRGATSDFAPRFVRDHGALLGMRVEDLEPVDARVAGRVEHRLYRQTYQGLPVEGSRLAFAFGRNGSALLFTARTAPGIELADTRPVVALERARARALVGLREPRRVAWDEGSLVVLPSRFSGLAGDRLAWRLRCHTEGPWGAWRMLVDAHSGELLERQSLIVTADPASPRVVVAGNVDGWVHDLTPFREELLVPFPHQMVLALDGPTPIAQTLTDDGGAFSFGELGLGDPSALGLQAYLAGPYAAVLQTGQTMPPALTLVSPATPGSATLTWDDNAALPAARAVFVHVNTAHDALKRIDPGFEGLDRRVTIVADDTTGACNAFATLSPEAPMMTFYAASGPCPDIAQIADVVYHEYGHLATMYVYLPEWAPGDLHEAFSDYFAGTIVDTALVGLDFTGEGTYLRSMDNDYVWPREECGGEEHCEGEVLAGALWHMRQNLIDAMGDRNEAVALADSLFHNLRKGRPMDVHECLIQALLQDDDDGDLSNGTPHLQAIAPAFERHQIGDFGVRFTHRPLYDTENPNGIRDVRATLRSIYPAVRDSVLLHYSVDGGTYNTVIMGGTGGQLGAQIPALPMGTTVRYYLTAVDESGRRGALPEDAPDEVFDYFVGTDTVAPEIAHETLRYPVAQQERLWFWATVTDNLGPLESVHAQVQVTEPESSWSASIEMQQKDWHAAPGFYEGCLERGDWEPGTAVAYHITAIDGSSQRNWARCPALDEITLETRRGRGYDFESVTDDFTFSGDWERGEPQGEPAPAPSGAQLVGTVLDGMYNPGFASDLTTREFDLTRWERARLEFHSWYSTEDEWDGGRVLASRDHGATWEPVIPAGGYPSWIYDTETMSWAELPAFAGEGRAWEAHQAPLDAFVGDTLMIRFHFWSDTSVTRLGWYLDNVRVVEAQALVAPEGLSTSWGEDGQVALSWQAPVGVDLGAGEFLGYHVYRTDDPEGDPEERRTAAPLTQTDFLDTAVTNGVRYRYGVTAVYASGESPLGETAVGYPYRAAIAAAEGVELDVEGVTAVSDTLVIANGGTGELRVSLHLGDPDDTFEDLVPRHTFDGVNDQGLTLLAEDPAGAPGPDLTGLWCLEHEGSLLLKFAFHDMLPDPRTDFTLLGYLDTDMSRETGLPAGELGADYFFAMGALVYQQARVLGYLMRALDAETVFAMAVPPYLAIGAGFDSAFVGAPLEMLGSPGQIGFAAQVIPSWGGGSAGAPAGLAGKESLARLREALLRAPARASAEEDSTGDFLPNPREIDWLAMESLWGMATPEEPLHLPLAFDFAGRDPGDLAAKLFITSNDADHPLAEVPITAHVWYLPPEQLASWATTSRAEGLLLEWSPAEPDSFEAFLLSRWGEQEEEGAAVQLAGGPITAADDSLYQYLDRGVESGRRYYYRLTGMTSGGDVVDLSPDVHPLYAPPAITRLAMEAPRPNPFRTQTTFRLHVPAGTRWDLVLVDVTGRLVRRLVPRTGGGPEVQMVAWDGRSQTGEPAAQGVYYAVARAGSRRVVRPVVLVK